MTNLHIPSVGEAAADVTRTRADLDAALRALTPITGPEVAYDLGLRALGAQAALRLEVCARLQEMIREFLGLDAPAP